jgi:Glycosyl transferase family 11
MDGRRTPEAPLITTMLQGGLGNQLFQYAMGLSASQFLRTRLQLDISLLDRGNPYRMFNLDLFEDVRRRDVVHGSKATVMEKHFEYDPQQIFNIKDGDVLRGYWQSEAYFEGVVPNLFYGLRPAKPMPQLFFPWAEERIEEAGDSSCFLGIRRGDYLLKQEYHGVLSIDYYKRALNLIHNMTGKTPIVFIFSDDMDWCKNELADKLGYPSIVAGTFFPTVGTTKGREDADLYLMSLCRNAVIANSSYHWWGAWLGDFKKQPRVVVAPKQWFTDPNMDSSTVVPERWIRL